MGPAGRRTRFARTCVLLLVWCGSLNASIIGPAATRLPLLVVEIYIEFEKAHEKQGWQRISMLIEE